MRRMIFVFVLLSSLMISGSPVVAQSAVEAESMQIDVWPEYDRKDALVIYRILLSAQTSLPAQISLRIPREAVQPFNVAYKDVDNKLYNMQYNSTTEGDWLRITATSPSLEIHFEYYDPRITRSTITRSLEYKWPGDLKVKAMTFRVQQPVNSSALKITPQQGNPSVESGFTYFSIPIGTVEANTGFTFQISYDKPDETLSAASQPVSPSDPITTSQANTTGAGSQFNTVIFGFAFGVVLIAAGLYWYFRTQRREPSIASRRRHAGSAPAQPRKSSEAGRGVYCHKCGKLSNPGDTFCRSCGTRLRLE